MTVSFDDTNRKVIPRWRPWRTTRVSGELAAAIPSRAGLSKKAFQPSLEDHQELANRLQALEAGGGVHDAADLLCTAVALGLHHVPGVLDAANRIINSNTAPEGARNIAGRVLGKLSAEQEVASIPSAQQVMMEARRRLAILRRIVREEPRNSIRWADLAHAHLVLGAHEPARKAMTVALALQPSNRFILRSAARMNVHIADPKAAHDLLVEDTSLLGDPWLLAAEIATADLAAAPLKHMRLGKRLLDSGFDPRHTSELATAMATIELKNGRASQARRLMRAALVSPSENSLAQAEWSASQNLSLVDPAQINEQVLTAPMSFEARAIHSFRKGDFRAAAVHGQLWQQDEAFSSKPAAFVSYTAALLLEDWTMAIEAARVGLIANPEDILLSNNLAYALIEMGKVSEAKKVVDRLDQRSAIDLGAATLHATRGLIEMRSGNINEGRVLYALAVADMRMLPDLEGATLAKLLWAREEIRLNTTYGPDLAREADAQAAQLTQSPEVLQWRARLKATLAGASMERMEIDNQP